MNIQYFFQGGDCSDPKDYRVRITADPGDSGYTEVEAGDSPFVVSYDNSASPFEPSRISTASLGVVFGDTIYDIFSPLCQGTKVELYNLTDEETEWKGYLKPNLYSQYLMNCEDDIDIDASDCLASLQYMEYRIHSGNTKAIVSFKDLLNDIVNAGGFDGYWIADTKSIYGTTISSALTSLKISEVNFFSSDIDEPWKYSEVLDELCKYLGYTAIQWKTKLYLVDYAYWGSHDSMPGTYFAAPDYNTGTSETITAGGSITQDKLRGAGTTLSFDTIYNKCVVHDSVYKVGDFIPDMFDDDSLTNRYGEGNYEEIYPVSGIAYLFLPVEEVKYRPIFINEKGHQQQDADDSAYKYFRKIYDSKNYKSIYRDWGGTEVTLSDAQKASTACTRNYIGGTLVDFMSYKDDTKSLNYEKQGTQNWERYLMISQKDYPPGHYYMRPSDGSAYVDIFPSIFELNSGYTCPVITDGEKSFLVLTCTGKWERYENRDYINPEWSNEAQGTVDEYYASMCTYIPNLFFLLAIGDKYWDGSKWTTTRSGFAPGFERSVSQNKKKQEVSDFKNWNKDLHVLNSVDWQEFAGEEGYKIPLDPSLDMGAEIKFEVHLPGKITEYWSTKPGKNIWGHDGVNNYVWLKDLSLKLTTTNTENAEGDLIYQNEYIINENSLNEFRDVDFKFTTFPNDGALSYSHIGYNGNFLETIDDASLAGKSQNAEENCIERWVSQFSTGTKKFDFTTDFSFSPLQKCVEGIYNTPCVPLSNKIDYGKGNQTMTLMEIKNLATGDAGNIMIVKREDTGDAAYTGGTVRISVISTNPWTVAADTVYGTLSVTGGTGAGVKSTVLYTFDWNIYTTRRSTNLTFTDTVNNTKQVLTVSQAAKTDNIVVYRYDPDAQAAMYPINDWRGAADGSSDVWVQVKSDTGEHSLSCEADWVHFTASGSDIYHITFSSNNTSYDKEVMANFTNSLGGLWYLQCAVCANNTIALTTVEGAGLISYLGGNIVVQVESASPWTASTESTAMGSFLTHTGQGGGIEQFAFVVGENTDNSVRQIQFSVVNSEGGSAMSIVFKQDAKGAPYGYFSYETGWYSQYQTVTPKIPLSGGSATVYVHSNVDWIIPASWLAGITYSPLTGHSGVTQINITCQPTNAERSVTVNIYDVDAQNYPIQRSNIIWIRQTDEQ